MVSAIPWLAGVQGGSGGASFNAPLQSSLVPNSSGGSSTSTSTRASTAYQIDFEGKANLVLSGEARMQGARRVENRLNVIPLGSENITGWGATANATLTNESDVPNSSFTGSIKLVTTAQYAAGTRASVLTSGAVYTLRWYAKGAVGGEKMWFSNAAAQGGQRTLTTDWQLFSTTFTNSNTTLQFGCGDVGGNTFWVTGLQVEDVTGQANQNPSEYVSVGVLSAPFHGANVDAVKYFTTLNGNTVASNVVTEATGAAIVTGASGVAATAPVDAGGPYGYWSEGARADVLGTTAAIRRTMADAGWVSGGGGITVGAATGLDGVASAAASLTAAGANGTILFTTVLGAAVRTFSAWVRRKTGTGTVNITGDNGATWTAITLTAAYQLVQFTTASAANPVVGFRIVTSADAIEVDFDTLEDATFAEPTPIPINVSHAADVDQYVSASNISATATTLYMELDPGGVLGSTVTFHFGTYVDANNYTALLSDGTNLIARKRIAAANTDATIAFTRTVGTVVKVAARFDTTNGIDVFLSGTKGTGSATLTASQIGTNWQVGADGNGANQDFSGHRNLKAYTSSLSDAALQSMTA